MYKLLPILFFFFLFQKNKAIATTNGNNQIPHHTQHTVPPKYTQNNIKLANTFLIKEIPQCTIDLPITSEVQAHWLMAK